LISLYSFQNLAAFIKKCKRKQFLPLSLNQLLDLRNKIMNFVDFQLVPPPFSEEETTLGIISLTDRGLIPPGSQLSIDPPPVQPKTVPLHNADERSTHSARSGESANLFKGFAFELR
jgi:hypothetical protein